MRTDVGTEGLPREAEPPVGMEPRWRRVRDRYRAIPAAWRRAGLAVLVLRVVVSILSFAFGGLLEGLDPVSVRGVAGSGFEGWLAESARQQGWGLLGAGLERFDALWYLSIARDGYPAAAVGGGVPGAAAFFPLFPLLTGVLGRVLGARFFLAGTLVATAAAVAALAGVHRLVEEETGDAALAGRAVTAAAVFPAAFFLIAPYTESLFLALSVWALVLARRRRWGWAALLALLTGLTRNIGVLLAVPLVLMAWQQWRDTGPRPGIGAWVGAVFGAPAGLGVYLGFSWLRFGDALAPVNAQLGWERTWTWPVVSLFDAWQFATDTPGLYPSGYHTIDVVIAAPILVAVVWLLVRTPLPYGAFAAANVVVWLVYPFPGRPLMSTYRFALAIAPLFWAFAAWTRRRGAETAWVATGAALHGVMLLLFVNWYYVF